MSLTDVPVTFTSQQLALIDRHVAARDDFVDRADLVRKAIRESQATATRAPAPSAESGQRGTGRPLAGRPKRDRPVVKNREVLSRTVITPGTGKALEVRRGEVVRVGQTVGGQCADFNLYDLNNRHHRLSVGRTRSFHGTGPTTGDFVWSTAPWESPLLAILADSGQTDTEVPSCSAQLYWRYYGETHHTNCQQMQTEAQREYGLAPHEVHESFNLFMYCEYENPDDPEVRPNRTNAEDFIEFLALEDVLAVFNVCGDDFDRTNNFTFSDLVITVMKGDSEDQRRVAEFMKVDHPYPLLPSPYPEVRSPLVKDPDYVASFPHAPVRFKTVSFHLSETEQKMLREAADMDLYAGDLGAALRDVTVFWTGRQPRRP